MRTNAHFASEAPTMRGAHWVALFLFSLIAATLVRADEAASVRLVSLAPNLTELVYALELGEYLVGRSSACDAPDAASSVAIVGGFGRPNLEALWQVRPDVVIVTDLEKPGLRHQLERRGVRVRVLPCESWEQIKDAATALAEAAGRPERAVQWNAQLDRRIAALRERAGTGSAPSVYVEVWGNPVTTAGGQSFLSRVIELAGGRNIAADLRGLYPTVSGEWVIRQDPDVILLAYMWGEVQAAQAVKGRVGWSSLSAIRHQRIIDEIDPDLLLRPGPRLIDGAEQLADALEALGDLF